MATYTIIGGDQKEYSYITADNVRQWITEGRLNAQSMAKAESDAEWRQLAQFPEFADLLAPQIPSPIAPTAFAPSTNFLERDYELDIGDCVSRAWNLFKSNLGILIGSFLLVLLISMITGGVSNGILQIIMPKQSLGLASEITGFLFSVVLALVVGPLMGGFYFLLLQVIRRQPANVGDVFCGFQRAFKQLFLGHLVVALIVSACLLPFNLMFASKAAPLLEQMRHTAPADMESIFSQFGSAFVGTLPIFLICMIPVTYLSVSWQFTLPLIIDKGMTFGTAMKTSWKMVGKHWWQVFGLTIVIGLLNVVGFCVCCVGLLFTVPIGFVAMMYAYETIFSETAT